MQGSHYAFHQNLKAKKPYFVRRSILQHHLGAIASCRHNVCARTTTRRGSSILRNMSQTVWHLVLTLIILRCYLEKAHFLCMCCCKKVTPRLRKHCFWGCCWLPPKTHKLCISKHKRLLHACVLLHTQSPLWACTYVQANELCHETPVAWHWQFL